MTPGGKANTSVSSSAFHSVSTTSAASTSSTRSRVFCSNKLSSFVGWGLRYAEFAGTMPLGRNSVGRNSTGTHESSGVSNHEKSNAGGQRNSLRKKTVHEKTQ